MELTSQNILHREILPAPVVILSIVDNSLLVYTADNTLHHYLIVPTADSIKLHLCGSISFAGVISSPGSVRMLSWMIPTVQKREQTNELSIQVVLILSHRRLVIRRRFGSGYCLDGSRWAVDSAASTKGIVILPERRYDIVLTATRSQQARKLNTTFKFSLTG